MKVCLNDVRLSVTSTWNPEKELKVDYSHLKYSANPFVESGEGIERTMRRMPSFAPNPAMWNPEKELKEVNRALLDLSIAHVESGEGIER